MHILVTGASGFSGSHIARFLARAGHRVVGIHRRETKFLASLNAEPRVTLARADLCTDSLVRTPFDCILHVGATSPGPGISDAALVADNVAATARLIALALETNCRRFILFSSISLYGEISQPVLDEATPIRDPDVYGATKLLCERLLAAQSARLAGLALRLPGIIGPGSHRNWLSGVAEKLAAGAPVPAYNVSGPYNNAVHIADLTRFVARLAERDWQGFDAMVLGARGTIALGAAVDSLATSLGVVPRIEEIPPLKPAFTLDSSHAMANWGYDPMEIGEMITRYGAELRDRAMP